MDTVRIFVGGLPRMMRAIVEDAVAQEPDMEIVVTQPADVAIVSDRELEEGGPGRVLRFDPRMTVLAMSPDGKTARLLEIRQTHVVPVSPSALVHAIRKAASAPRPM